LGDIFNLVGCIVGKQQITQTILAVYFCVVDAILIVQYYHYYKKRRSIAEIQTKSDDEYSPLPTTAHSFAILLTFGALCYGNMFREDRAFGTRKLLGCASAKNDPVPLTQEIIGGITSWASGVFYVGSRIPQIFKNYKRKSVEGLAVGMFMITLTANLLYGFSIILRKPVVDTLFWETTFAYIVGSIGTVMFDIALLVQSFIYREKTRRLSEQREHEDDTEKCVLISQNSNNQD
jgi:uncharacterized protein with PQ loop repeat